MHEKDESNGHEIVHWVNSIEGLVKYAKQLDSKRVKDITVIRTLQQLIEIAEETLNSSDNDEGQTS